MTIQYLTLTPPFYAYIMPKNDCTNGGNKSGFLFDDMNKLFYYRKNKQTIKNYRRK